jgi:hypothetical protein
MRDLLSKVMTGSMVAGAALLVAACGGGEDAAANNVATNYVEDPLMGANDVTAVDAMNGTEANLGVSTDANATTTTTTNTTTTDTATNTGTGNTTGM